MKKDYEYSLIVVLVCIFAMSLILNIGILTKHIIINRNDCQCDIGK